MLAEKRSDFDARTSQPASGSLGAALQHAERLMNHAPALAAQQAEAILEVVPGHPVAHLLLGRAWRLMGRFADAQALLATLAETQPRAAAVHLELGQAALSAGDEQGAMRALSMSVKLDAKLTAGWLLLAEIRSSRGEDAAAAHARAQSLRSSACSPVMVEAALALCDDRLDVAEALLRQHLRTMPADPAAIRMLAEVAARLGRHEDAATLLEDCLAIDPAFDAARGTYAQVLQRQGRLGEALQHIDVLLAKDRVNPGWQTIKAAVLVRLGRFDDAIALYASLLDRWPRQSKGWMSYGHALKTVGRQGEAIAAYRRAIELQPSLGEAWWSLANLKTVSLTEDDIGQMRASLGETGIDDSDRLHLDFAIAKALEDAGSDEAAFGHYLAGNMRRGQQLRHCADHVTQDVDQLVSGTGGDFFKARKEGGCQAADPIFILGMPRAGSTLVEQILASHSLVEGTMELPDIPALARRLVAGQGAIGQGGMIERLAALSASERTALGEEYLHDTRLQRHTDKPFFTDKMPNNWLHVALIKLILPRARIIDARRHPMACCWSVFKQHFARGQSFSYGLSDVGRYYRDYVRLMAHVDAVAPGSVHRVIYETMVSDTQGEVRALLDHLGLPFEANCLAYWQNDRAVRTASSEQVRKPIFSDAVDHWQRFDPWLGELRAALGPIVATYPQVN